jgi:U3 small nucleolar RNA-associated protein 12
MTDNQKCDGTTREPYHGQVISVSLRSCHGVARRDPDRHSKFEHSKTFGQICSAASNAVWIPDHSPSNKTISSPEGRAIVGANEDVLCWNIKKGELAARWSETSNSAQVTKICQSHLDNDVFAVGYEDGKVRVWDSRTATVIVSFNGHKSGVTHLQFDDSGVRLASGSRDTDIVLWDLVAEVGLFRLKGHKDQITSLNFLRRPSEMEAGAANEQAIDSTENTPGFLISTSKDALVKIWDLSTQHCIETHVTQSNGECWNLGLSPDESGCITAGNDGELRIWSIDSTRLVSASTDQSDKVLKDRGSIYRLGKDRTTGISFHPHLDLVALHGSEKAIEFWRIRSESEMQRTLARKQKRRREQEADQAKEAAAFVTDEKTENLSTALAAEVFVPYVIVRTGGKVRSVAWADRRVGSSVSILVGTTNNQLEVYSVAHTGNKPKKEEQPDYSRTFSVDVPGHRGDIRCLALSSDDRMLASASNGILKIWNVRTQSCIRTFNCGYALCTAFLPGDKILVIGTREGTIEIFDIASSTLLETMKAHDRDIWSLQVHPDGKSLVTGSADKSAHFWEFQVVREEILGTTRKNLKLKLVHTRTLRVSDDVFAIRYSPDGRLLAVSTLDNTVKVFFSDNLQLFLTLYGHKLPVLSIDISFDSKLILTSSADKNVRVWGLDFGDCHKAFFAHQDSIMSVAFVPNNNEGNGHHFFSASKDKIIKYYDGDKFEQIQKLDGHHGEIWAMVIAHSGNFLVSASHDKSIRIWQQTDERIFLEEEREKELEDLYESTLVTSLAQDGPEAVGGEQVLAAGKQTAETLMAGERVAEALELGFEDLDLVTEYQNAKAFNPKAVMPPRNHVFLANGNVSASDYVLKIFQRIPSASLQDALLVLSFSQIPALFTFLALWASERKNVPLTCRILLFLLNAHQKQLVNSQLVRPLLEDVRRNLRLALHAQKGEIGINLAGLRVAGRCVQEIGENEYVDVDPVSEKERAQNNKRTFVNVA